MAPSARIAERFESVERSGPSRLPERARKRESLPATDLLREKLGKTERPKIRELEPVRVLREIGHPSIYRPALDRARRFDPTLKSRDFSLGLRRGLDVLTALDRRLGILPLQTELHLLALKELKPAALLEIYKLGREPIETERSFDISNFLSSLFSSSASAGLAEDLSVGLGSEATRQYTEQLLRQLVLYVIKQAEKLSAKLLEEAADKVLAEKKEEVKAEKKAAAKKLEKAITELKLVLAKLSKAANDPDPIVRLALLKQLLSAYEAVRKAGQQAILALETAAVPPKPLEIFLPPQSALAA